MLPNRLRKRLRRSNDRHLLVTTTRDSGALEEDILNVALAVSREESAKEEELRKSDDIRLRIALEESRRCYKDDAVEAYDCDVANPEQYQASVTKTTATSEFENGDDDYEKHTPVSTWCITSFGFSNSENSQPASESHVFCPHVSSAPPTIITYSRTGNANEINLRYLLQTQPTNDPWAPVQTVSEYQFEFTMKSNDPWNNLLTDTEDLWTTVFPEPMETPADFDWFLPLVSEPSLLSSELNPATIESHKRTASHDNFLGHAASFVDLDNLMSPPIPSIPGYNPFITPPFSSTNPFI